MKKLLLSLILLSTSTAFASEAAAELKEVQEAQLRVQQLLKNAASLDKTIDPAVVGKVQDILEGTPGHSLLSVKAIEGFIIAHPWYSVFGIAVFTFAAIKAWDYFSKSNKDDEDPDSAN